MKNIYIYFHIKSIYNIYYKDLLYIFFLIFGSNNNIIIFLMNALNKNDALLDFCYLTASFYNYVKSSGINFKNIISKYNKIEHDKNKNNTISNIENDFDLLNNSNSMNYFENLSLLNNFEKDIKEEKIKLIKSVFGNIIEENQIEKIILCLSEKINCSMLSDKYLLVKFLSGQIIDYVFLIYELFYNLIKNYGEISDKKIHDIISNNLLEEDKLKKLNKKLSSEIIDLKNIIEIKNKNIDNNLKIHKKLIEIKKNLENDSNKIKRDMKNIKKEFNNLQNESKEKIKLLNLDLKEYKEKNFDNETEDKESNEINGKKNNSEDEIKDPSDNIEFLVNKIKKLQMNYSTTQEEIEKLKKSNIELNKKLDDYYEEKFMKRLNCQIIIDSISSKNENSDNQQKRFNIQIKINDLLTILEQIRKDYKIDNNKIKKEKFE